MDKITFKAQIIDFINARRKYFLASLMTLLLCVLVFEWFSRNFTIGYVLPGQYCLPYSAWFVKKGVMPGRGEYVSFLSRSIPNCPDGIHYVKILAGIPGDRVEVSFRSDYPALAVEVDNKMVYLQVKGHVYLHTANGETTEYRTYKHDAKGRPLPIIASQTIPEGKYFVTGTAPRSYDSRYWGLIDAKDIIGQAYPIF